MQDYIKINPKDNVAVALKPLAKGTVCHVGGQEVTLREEIPQGHKFTLQDIAEGQDVIKYGFRIGTARETVQKGGWIHVHNLKTALGDLLTYSYNPTGKAAYIRPYRPCVHIGRRQGKGCYGYRRSRFPPLVSVGGRRAYPLGD